MIFTRRTYRVAIRRSIQWERKYYYGSSPTETRPEMRERFRAYRAQVNHTRKLQARKRKERK